MKDWTPDDIRQFRLKIGISQEAFGELLGVTRVYVNYLERGVRKPSRTMMALLGCLKRQMKHKKKGGEIEKGKQK